MMEIVTEWITQIIIFILAATIIDLLIPDLSMKKYIKLVLGLILILILLTPIFSLFHMDFESVINDQYQAIFETDGIRENVEHSIEMQKSEIESTHEAYILEEMAVQLKSLTNDELQKEHGAQIAGIDFVFEEESNKTYEDLTEVIVYLEKSTDGEGSIAPVKEIVIDTSKREEMEVADEAIIELLREKWELEDKKITVYWEGGTS